MPRFRPRPVTLEGYHVRLEPLDKTHAQDLFAVGREEVVWRYLPRPAFQDLADVTKWIESAKRDATNSAQIPFAIIHRRMDRAIGSTRYLEIRHPHRGLEIGYTWIAMPFQRTEVNTECKYLMLKHAFESLGALRVQFKTDSRNDQSCRAIERIGAVREGILRRHMVVWDQVVRDSVCYSIVDVEWPMVKGRLEVMLDVK
jgi:N-acetyltransferase